MLEVPNVYLMDKPFPDKFQHDLEFSDCPPAIRATHGASRLLYVPWDAWHPKDLYDVQVTFAAVP